jgi:hypothetical protein
MPLSAKIIISRIYGVDKPLFYNKNGVPELRFVVEHAIKCASCGCPRQASTVG